MADDTDTLGPLLADLAQYGIGSSGVSGANAVTQKAYESILRNLQDRFGDYNKLGTAGYKPITAQQLGPSALGGIQPDAQARIDEQSAISQLDDIAKSGGLTLADKNSLNQIEQTLSRNTGARNASLANQYAARGQLGAGQQLAMQLAGNQEATQSANQRGEDTAAQAQKRAMEAVLNKSSASRAMSNDDYARKKAAAEATDSISKYNASMSTDASKYNNTIAGQAYEDQLAKLRGQAGLTDSMNTALLGSGKQNANTIAGQSALGAGLVGAAGQGVKALGKLGSGGSGSGGGDVPPPSSDESGGRGGPADLTGGNSDTTDPTTDSEGFDQYPT